MKDFQIKIYNWQGPNKTQSQTERYKYYTTFTDKFDKYDLVIGP